ncbi:MAG: hypothetical protein OXH79_05255 [Boseongicola sp.]|nr:hypothetical protein [Boseongicola sp.]
MGAPRAKFGLRRSIRFTKTEWVAVVEAAKKTVLTPGSFGRRGAADTIHLDGGGLKPELSGLVRRTLSRRPRAAARTRDPRKDGSGAIGRSERAFEDFGRGEPIKGRPAPATLQEQQSFPKRRKPDSGTGLPVFSGQIRAFGELLVDVAIEVNLMLARRL